MLSMLLVMVTELVGNWRDGDEEYDRADGGIESCR